MTPSERKARARRRAKWPTVAIDAARRHGEDTDPEHEVGDLQGLIYALWKLLDDTGRSAAIRDFVAWDAPECPRCATPLRMCADADPACMHCDNCDWCGDPAAPAPRKARAPERPTDDGADARIHLTVDGEPTTLASFARNNPDLIEEPWADEGTLRQAIRSMEIGDAIEGGGGAGATWRLVRVAAPATKRKTRTAAT